jgi:hypothetical protein
MNKLNVNKYLYNWIRAFLSQRKFVVQLNNLFSEYKDLKCGVPQGSCLSPTLFILYFSDIANCIPSEEKIALFADDLCIWFTLKDKIFVEKTLQLAIDRIQAFCQKWGFIINKSNTNYTTFTSAGHRSNHARTYGLNLRIESKQIPLEPFPTFLGITLDPKLCFKQHIQNTRLSLLFSQL